MKKKYIVRQTKEEQSRLPEVVSKGKAAAYTIKREYVIESGCEWVELV